MKMKAETEERNREETERNGKITKRLSETWNQWALVVIWEKGLMMRLRQKKKSLWDIARQFKEHCVSNWELKSYSYNITGLLYNLYLNIICSWLNLNWIVFELTFNL
jgi:hypothetical protein